MVEDKTGQKAIGQAADIVAKYDGDSDTEIHITNNLPYIQTLNTGTSAQAPEDFVGKSVKKAIKVIDGAELLKPMVD